MILHHAAALSWLAFASASSFADIFTTPLDPVPEPSTSAMMLAGLGATAFFTRPRRAV